MIATYLHDGNAIDHIPATDLPLGAVVVIADTIGIATRPIPAGALGALALTGVFELPRVAGGVIPQGKRLTWDPVNQHATADLAAPGVVPLGIATATSPDTAATVRVRLNH